MNQIFQGVVGLFIAAILAFWFNKRLEISVQRQKLQTDTYSSFVESINNLHTSIFTLVAGVGGFDNQCTVIGYKDKSLGNDEKRKQGYMVSGEIYELWHNYDKEVIDRHLDVVEKLGTQAI